MKHKMKKSEVRRQQSEVRSQRSGVRIQASETCFCHSDPAVAGEESQQLLSPPTKLQGLLASLRRKSRHSRESGNPPEVGPRIGEGDVRASVGF
jgi:hypothetical protein